jgi:hypothetical protein
MEAPKKAAVSDLSGVIQNSAKAYNNAESVSKSNLARS